MSGTNVHKVFASLIYSGSLVSDSRGKKNGAGKVSSLTGRNRLTLMGILILFMEIYIFFSPFIRKQLLKLA